MHALDITNISICIGMDDVYSSSSRLNTVRIYGVKYPLDGIETISASISNFTFYYLFPVWSTYYAILPHDLLRIKGGTKLRENTPLKELYLIILLDDDEVQDIIDSLKDNTCLERLVWFEEYHSQYFSELVMDPCVILRPR